jgi:hypothetical protein
MSHTFVIRGALNFLNFWSPMVNIFFICAEIQKNRAVTTHYIYKFQMVLTVGSDFFFLTNINLSFLCNRDLICSPCYIKLSFKCYLDEFQCNIPHCRACFIVTTKILKINIRTNVGLPITKTNKQTPWSESVSVLYRLSDRRLSPKWLPTFADRRCHVVSVTDPYGRILGFLDRSRYFSIK